VWLLNICQTFSQHLPPFKCIWWNQGFPLTWYIRLAWILQMVAFFLLLNLSLLRTTYDFLPFFLAHLWIFRRDEWKSSWAYCTSIFLMWCSAGSQHTNSIKSSRPIKLLCLQIVLINWTFLCVLNIVSLIVWEVEVLACRIEILVFKIAVSVFFQVATRIINVCFLSILSPGGIWDVFEGSYLPNGL